MSPSCQRRRSVHRAVRRSLSFGSRFLNSFARSYARKQKYSAKRSRVFLLALVRRNIGRGAGEDFFGIGRSWVVIPFIEAYRRGIARGAGDSAFHDAWCVTGGAETEVFRGFDASDFGPD